jgi:hypothetical protein
MQGIVKPQRIQVSRRAGFRLQEVSRALNGLPASKCTRPGPFGNPFKLSDLEAAGITGTPEFLHGLLVEKFKSYCPVDSLLAQAARRLLVGKNLGCTCRPELPCHVSWLIEVANS